MRSSSMRIFNKKILKLLILLFIFVFIFYIINIIFNKQKCSVVETFESPNFPPIKRFDNILTSKECQQIINLARPKLERSKLGIDRKIGIERTSQQTWIDKKSLPCINKCSDFVAKLTGLPVENQELWQVLRYKPGQEYKPHYDACSETTDEYETCLNDEKNTGWGKRVNTFLIYLNDVEEGGETHFPRLNKSFKPKRGSAILWNNLTADQTKAHPNSEHAGMPVKKGEKWAVNVWVRQNPPNNT